MASTFSQRTVADYEHFITGLTEQVLDRMPASGETFDFVDAVAKEVPIRVLAQVMGLPADDLDLFRGIVMSAFSLRHRLAVVAAAASLLGSFGAFHVGVVGLP